MRLTVIFQKTKGALVVSNCILRCAYLKNLLSFSSTNDFEKEGGFMFFMPKEVLSGRNVNACISLHNAKLPAEVAVDVQILGEHHFTNKSIESGRKF